MKRLPALLLTFLLMLAGCSAKEPTNVTIDRSFCCPAAVEQNGLRYEAELTVAPEQCAAVFSAPEELKGVTMTCRNGGVTVRYGESAAETPLPNPRQCFLYWLDRALTQTEAAVNLKENEITLQGMIENQKYLLTIDRKSCRPLYVEIDSLDLTIRLLNSEQNR